VPVPWPEALDRVAAELDRVYIAHGPRAIFGGSYGWASAGRFHDAQHQLHRFLNLAGGYVRSVNSYSSGAASVLLPHVIGPQSFVAGNNVSWDEMVAHSTLVLAFGGMALKNNDVGGGGTSQHIAKSRLTAARRRGVEFHLVSPLRDDLSADVEAVWHPIRPGTDVALMLGLAHALVSERRHDRAFLGRYCVGWERFEAYLLGGSDGQPKTAEWAAGICGIPADLGRLRRAFCRPDTVIVQESVWTATARHADIVLPATITLEREDIGGTAGDPLLVAMHQAVTPYGSARDDHAIFAALADRLGFAQAFTEGRTVRQWLEHLYEQTRRALAERGVNAPSFAEFWEDGELVLPTLPWDGGPIREFRRDPDGRPLPTPSGRIEIVSETVAGFAYADCPGHPTWMPPAEAATAPAVLRFPLQLIANQPATRLHSQLDFGATSLAAKVQGREPVRVHPRDATDRGIRDGDIVRIHNDRGACLAGAVLSDALRPGVVQLATGAWYDPQDPAAPAPFCVHGNPNVLTRDVGTSRLAQGCTGQVALVEIERFVGSLPSIKAFDPPRS
jgi:anaerobic selenocysteine-containing dehydrogenase